MLNIRRWTPPQKQAGIGRIQVYRWGHYANDAEWSEAKVKRGGDPKHPGRFSEGSGGKSAKPEKAAKAATKAPEATPARQASAETYMSPNASTLDFDKAITELGGKRQKVFNEVSDLIDKRLGLQRTHVANVLGAWSDGAENSLFVEQTGDLQAIRAAAAMKGWISAQKAVLVFSPNTAGTDAMVSFDAKGDLKEIHNQLLQDGLAFHTLEPTEGGAKVHILVRDDDDKDGSVTDAINRSSEGFNSDLTTVYGNGEFIGNADETGTDDEQRTRARVEYKNTIRQAQRPGALEGRNLSEIWANAYHHWRGRLAADQAIGDARELTRSRIYRWNYANDKEWDESKVKRGGDPENAGRFSSGSGGKPAKAAPKEPEQAAEPEKTERQARTEAKPTERAERGSQGETAQQVPERQERAPDGSASALFEAHHDPKITAEHILASLPPSTRVKIDETEARLAKAIPTNALVSEGGHKNPDGTWTREREAVWQRIISEILTPEAIARAKPRPGEKPTYTVLGGRGGSGKSWLTSEAGPVDGSRVLKLDSDAIKEKLPEYQGWNAAMVHREASEIFSRIDETARKYGLNVVHDATMRTPDREYFDKYQQAGYNIDGYYMFLPPEKAAERAVGRFLGESGRYVPISYIMGSTTNEKSFDEAKANFRNWKIYDNDVPRGQPPRYVSGSDDER